jgi:hypothetical protein
VSHFSLPSRFVEAGVPRTGQYVTSQLQALP